MKQIEKIKLGATKGNKTIARANDVFTGYIDNDFKKWNTDIIGKNTIEMEMVVCELTEDATFKQMFTKPEEMVMTQGQIIEFCTDQREKLQKGEYATLFLFKVSDEFFVAHVYVRSDGQLGADVYRFSRERVWGAEYGHRLVLPQLSLESSETINSTLTETSVDAMIDKLKELGYQVSKIY